LPFQQPFTLYHNLWPFVFNDDEYDEAHHSKPLNDTNSSVEIVHNQVQPSLSKPVIKPWEEI